MNYPLISEYIDSIRAAEDNFDQLKHLRPVLDDDGQPIMSGGNFAVVFKLKDELTGKFYAAKCFLKDQEGRAEAYHQITEELEHVSSSYLTPFKYLDKELFVDAHSSDETEFPVLLMDWIEGIPLDTYINIFKNDQYRIHRLFGSFCQFAIWLLNQPFAHGDLKPDNILICDDGRIVVVDYDGMYVPAMKGQKAREIGSPDFRHPSRSMSFFNDRIDIFSLTSIALSLSYIASLNCFNVDESSNCYFFQEADMQDPTNSKLLFEIISHSKNTYCGLLLSSFFLSLTDINASKETIIHFFSSIINNNTSPTAFEENNSFEVDNIRYSFDGRKIIGTIYDIDNYNVLEINEGVEILCNNCLSYNNYEIIQLPSTLEIIGKSVFSNEIRLFISNSPLFIVGECGLFTSDKKELIKCYSNNKESILHLFQETTLVRNDDYIQYPYAVKGDVYYSLSYENNDEYVKIDKIHESLFEDKDGAIYSKDKKELLYFPMKSEIREYAILDGCEKLLKNSFISDLSVSAGGHGDVDISIIGNNIETLHFPSSLTTIEEGSLLGCINLRCIFIEIEKEPHFNTLLRNYNETNYGYRRFQLNNDMFVYETKSTEEDEKDCIIDDFGFKYSNDGIKLISANHTELPYHIPEGVKIICDGAFYLIDCPNLFLPDSLISIGKDCFADCSFEHIEVPLNVRSIDNGAFLGEGLVSIKIKGNIRYMGSRVFSPDDNGSSLKYVELSEGVLDLGSLTFYGCYDLKSIALPSTLISMGDNPFAHSGIEEIINNSRYYKIENGCVLKNWSNHLISYYGKQLKMSFDNIDTIGNYAFAGNQHLQSISFTGRTWSIGKGAFDNCRSLNNVILSQSTRTIGESAFQGCSNLTIFETPPMVLEIEDSTFNGCRALHNVTFPLFLSKIGKDSFSQCPSLYYIEIPPHLKEIIGNPFEKDNSGMGISEMECLDNRYFHIYMGGLYNTSTKTLVSAYGNNERFIVEDGTEFIGDSAFQYCKSIISVDLPSSVLKIGDYGFWGCEKLEYVIMRENIKEIIHPYSMFEFCKSLQNIYVRNNDQLFSLLYKSNREFRNKLKKLEITTPFLNYGDMVNNIWDEDGAYYDDDNRIVRYGDTYRNEYAIKEGTKVICDMCFFDEYNEIDYYYLSNLYIPKSIEYIGNNPFCGSIENIKCDSPYFIVDGSFLLTIDRKKVIFYFGRDNIVSIPKGIEEIGGGAFCSRELQTVRIPSTVRKIADNPFVGVHNYNDETGFSAPTIISYSNQFKVIDNTLIDIINNNIISYWGEDTVYIIDDSIKSIGVNAFFGSKLEQIELPNSIEYIDETAFAWCFNLNSVRIPKGTKYEMKQLMNSSLQSYIVEK